MSKIRKHKNLNKEIQRMENQDAQKEREHSKTLLTEKVRKKLNEAYKPDIRSVIKKVKKRKQKS